MTAGPIPGVLTGRKRHLAQLKRLVEEGKLKPEVLEDEDYVGCEDGSKRKRKAEDFNSRDRDLRTKIPKNQASTRNLRY